MAFRAGLRPLKPAPGFVDDLGLGCAPIGGDLFAPVTEAEAVSTVHAALEQGIAFFDTAPHYAAGRSEERLGAALQGVARDSFSVATKVGRVIVDENGTPVTGGSGSRTVADASADGVARSVEQSLRRLRLERVDGIYLHDPEDAHRALQETLPAMAALRDEGVVRWIGVGMNVSAPLARYVAEFDVDVVMVAGRYTLLDTSAADELLPVAERRDVGVVAAGVFNTGVLADPRPDSHYDYRPVPHGVLDRAVLMQQTSAAWGVDLAAAAMRFPLRHPAVDAVVIGARSPDEVHAAARNMRVDVPPGMWGALSCV